MGNILITQIGENGDNNAFFPSAGGGKICMGKEGRIFVVYATTSGTITTMSYDGHKWKEGGNQWNLMKKMMSQSKANL